MPPSIHLSHVIVENWEAPDPHSPAWVCTTCWAQQCTLCSLEADDPLAEPCPEKEWWMS